MARGHPVQVISSSAKLAEPPYRRTLELELAERGIPFASHVDLPPERLVGYVDDETQEIRTFVAARVSGSPQDVLDRALTHRPRYTPTGIEPPSEAD